MLNRLFSPASSGIFKTRSADRDIATDAGAVLAIAKAIDLALEKAKAEHAGLKRRMEDVISRAAIVGGNEIEDDQTRSQSRSTLLHKNDIDIRAGEQRLRVIENNISHFEHLRTDIQGRFPGIDMGHNGQFKDAV